MMHRLLAVCLMSLPALAAADDPPVFRWLREIELPKIEAVTLVAVPLDSHVFEHTRAGRPDIRLRNEQVEAVGFVIRAASESKSRVVRSTWTAEQMAAKVDAAEGLQVTLSLRDKEAPPTGIRIVTPLQDFEHQVRMESSAEGVTWQSAGPPTVIFDYSKYVDARNDLVSFKAGEHRHFRLTVEEISAEQESQLLELHRRLRGGEETERSERTTIARRPFRIDKLDFYRDDLKTESGETRKIAYPAADFEVTEHAKDHQTLVTFRTQREPVTQIEILSDSENFSRAAKVEAEVEDANGTLGWKTLATGNLMRFAVGDIQKKDVTLSVGETHASHYRVVIENRDSPPLAITGVELTGPLYELTFLATPGQKLQLEYGSPDADAGKFDIAALQAAISQHQAAGSGELGPPQANASAPVPSASWKPWNDSRVQIGVIIAVTALLGWGLYQAGTRIKPPEA